MTPDNPWTPRLKKALALAAKNSREKQDNYIGVEHALIAILKVSEDSPHLRDIFVSAGLDFGDITARLSGAYGRKCSTPAESLLESQFEPWRRYFECFTHEKTIPPPSGTIREVHHHYFHASPPKPLDNPAGSDAAH